MKRVLVFSLAYFPFVGGAEVALREVMKRLPSYEFRVVTARMRPLPGREFIDGVRVCRLGVGVQWLDKLLFFPLSFLYGLFYRSDVIFGLLENQAGLAALAVSWVKGRRCIINLQSGDSEEYIRGKLGLFYFLYNWLYGKRAVYVVLSNYLKDRALRHGVPEGNIVIIPNGVDASVFSCRGKKRVSSRNIITSSRLVLKNAVDDVVRALPIVKKSIPKATLTICGVGEDEDKLRQLSAELGVSDSVNFAGFVSHNDLPDFLCRAGVFVRPSVSEGFGNSFIEALSCGVPIVGTPVGGIPDFLVDGKTGLFAKVRDPEDIARQIVRLLKDKKLSARIVRNGQKIIKERYEWERIAGQFAEVLG